MKGTMRIGIVARLKHGDLLETLEKLGMTQKQAAYFLGMNQMSFGKLINLKWVPKNFTDELREKLYALTEKSPEELFPEWARKKDFLNMPKVRKQIIEAMPSMIQAACPRLLLKGPEEARRAEEVKEIIDKTMKTVLSPREEQVVRRTIMVGETDKLVGKDFNLTGARIAQIRAKALTKLRHPANSHTMRKCLENIRIP